MRFYQKIKGVALLNRLTASEVYNIKSSSDPETVGHYEKMVMNPVIDLFHSETLQGAELFRAALNETEEWKKKFLKLASNGEEYKHD